MLFISFIVVVIFVTLAVAQQMLDCWIYLSAKVANEVGVILATIVYA